MGESFCAGGDIATLTNAGEDPAAPDAYEGMGRILDSFHRLRQVKVPTIAAVRGCEGGAPNRRFEAVVLMAAEGLPVQVACRDCKCRSRAPTTD